MIDPWKEIRKGCFGNVEPSVELIAKTEPLGDFDIEELPALSASISYGSEVKGIWGAKKLNQQLIQKLHLTPLESVSFNFLVSGISKACGAQLSRHRIGQGHVSLSRRYTKQKSSFIYPLFDYLEDEATVRHLYQVISDTNRSALSSYKNLLDNDAKKGDARLVMPVSVSTERQWWINARALRDFFRLRLDLAAEWEIRRLAYMLLDLVYMLTPSLFEDIYEKFNNC